MPVFVNRAKVSTATTGTGTITLGSEVAGFQTFADAGVTDGDVVSYVIEDGVNWEVGTGTYTASGTTLSRTVSESSNSDAAISLSGTAIVFVMALAEDIQQPPSEGAFVDGDKTKLDGLGTISTQAANNVAITGGSISGITDLAVADGGTGASTATAARLNLGAAPLASPAFTGSPTAPTQTAGDNSTKLATTAYVDAAAGGGGGFVPISKTTVSGSPSAVDIELPSGYEQYMMLLDIVEPATDGQPFHLRASNDGGSTFISGSFSHEWEVIQVKVVSGTPTVSGRASNNDNEIVLADNVGVNGYERIDFAKIIVYQPKTGTRAHVEWTIRYRDSSNAVYFESGSGAITSSTTNLTDLRFLFNSGNVSTGIFHLFGIVDGDA
jgi:hypothetical protein